VVSRKQQKAIHANLKRTDTVQVTKKFGIGSVPVGTKGIVTNRNINGKVAVLFRKGGFLVPKTKLKKISSRTKIDKHDLSK